MSVCVLLKSVPCGFELHEMDLFFWVTPVHTPSSLATAAVPCVEEMAGHESAM